MQDRDQEADEVTTVDTFDRQTTDKVILEELSGCNHFM